MLYKIIRIFVAIVFIFSGWTKAIDPMGGAYKIEEYLGAFGMNSLLDMAPLFSVLLSSIELFLGIMLLLNFWRKTIAYTTTLFLTFFTILTVYILFSPSSQITECGCFGDALLLSNTETFIKNILLISLSIIYTKRIHKSNHIRVYYNDKRGKNIIKYVTYVSIFAFSLYIPLNSLINLPPYDYLPFNRGVDLGKIVENSQNGDDGDYETILIYRNLSSGELKEFSVESTEWQDTSKWEYEDTKTITKRESSIDALTNFSVIDINNENVADSIFSKNRNYTFLVIAQDINELDDNNFDKLRFVNELNRRKVAGLYLLTSSSLERADSIIKANKLSFKSYNVDATVLKSMIRSHKGIMMLNKGVIVGKWNFRANTINNLVEIDIPMLIKWEKLTNVRYFTVLGILIAILSVLVITAKKNHT